MNLFKRLFRTFVREAPAETSPSAGGTFSASLQTLGLVGSSPMSVAAAYRCVEVIAGSVSCLPLRVQHANGGLFTDRPADRLSYLLNVQPCAGMSAPDFWSAVIRRLLLDGNAYIVPVYSTVGYEVEALMLCNRGTVSHDALRDTYLVNDTAQGLSGTYAESEIIHLKHLTHDGKTGLSVLTYAHRTLDTAGTGDAETLTRFANGGNVRGFVTNGNALRGFGEYQDAELNKTAKSIDRRFSEGEKIVELPGQVDFRQVTMTSADMQFLESRKFTVREICRFFGVPPSFVYDDTATNYKSAENAYADFLNATLSPILRKIECELLRKLYPASFAHLRRIIFDRRELNACDLESRVRYQTATIAAGLYTVNEWRAAENKPPVEGGDRALVSANLRDLTELQNTHNEDQEKK